MTIEERVGALERALAWYEKRFCSCPTWGRDTSCKVHGDFYHQGVPHIYEYEKEGRHDFTA